MLLNPSLVSFQIALAYFEAELAIAVTAFLGRGFRKLGPSGLALRGNRKCDFFSKTGVREREKLFSKGAGETKFYRNAPAARWWEQLKRKYQLEFQEVLNKPKIRHGYTQM